LRAGARGATVDAATSGAAVRAATSATGGCSPVGVHTGLAMGVHVCCGAAGAGAGVGAPEGTTAGGGTLSNEEAGAGS
jgi:hypothetical protein